VAPLTGIEPDYGASAAGYRPLINGIMCAALHAFCREVGDRSAKA